MRVKGLFSTKIRLQWTFLLPLAVLLFCSQALAANITYPGTPPASVPGESGATFANSIFPTGSTVGNTVTITGGSTIGGSVYGGVASGTSTDAATGNSVLMQGGRVTYNVTGGWSKTNTAFNNSIHISGGRVDGKVFGGWVDGGSLAADFNKVLIEGSTTIGGNIYGGYTQGTGGAVQNRVLIYGGTFLSTVKIIAGGYGALSASADTPGDSPVLYNSVTIYDGIFNNANVYGGRMQGTHNTISNDVHIYGGTIGGDVFGGENINGTGTVNQNSVYFSGGTVKGNIYGGSVSAGAGSAANNLVVIAGGTLNGSAYGGQAKGTGAANSNTVQISSGSIAGDVYGGYSITSATNNHVQLIGGSVTGTVYGSNDPSNAWATSGNRLEVKGGLVTVGSLANFQYATVTPAGNINILRSTPVVFNTLTNNGLISFYNGIADQNIAQVQGAYSGSGTFGLEVLFGQTSTQFDADSIQLASYPGAPINLTFKALPGSSASTLDVPVRIATITGGGPANAFTSSDAGYGSYVYEIFQVNNEYFLKLSDKPSKDLSKVHSEAASASLAQLAHSSSILLLETLSDSVSQTAGKGFGLGGSIGAGHQKLNTGSHVDVSGLTGLVALSWNNGTPFAVGAFAEFFTGRYQTSNKATTGLGSYTIEADGDLNSFGGGVFVQYRAKGVERGMNPRTPGLHMEASARIGQSNMDFMDNSVVDKIKYSKSSLYYGASLGGGYVFSLSEEAALDTYIHGIWTREAATTIEDNLGQEIHFDALDSVRVVAGGRASYAVNNTFAPYAGLAVDWETMGKPVVYVDSYKANKAKLTGLTGIAEVGVMAQGGENVHFDFKGYGNLGKREGFGGMASVRVDF